MITFRTILFVLALIFPFQLLAQNSQSKTTIRIDPDAAMGGTVSQYINKVEFITFESNSQSAFGNIDQLEITDKYYIIMDSETQSVFIFDKQGRFHAKIDGKKINPQQPSFFCFKLDRVSNTIKINFLTNEFTFDLNGKIKTHNTRRPDQYLGVEASLGNYSAYYFYVPQIPSKNKDSLAYEITVRRNGKIVKQYLPYSLNINYDDSQGSQSHMDFWPSANTDTLLYYTRDYDYNVYQLTPHSFQSVYNFVFPLAYSLQPNFRTDTFLNGKRQKYIKANRQRIFKISNIYNSPDYLFFRIVRRNFDDPSFLFSKKSKGLININKIVSDAGSYFLPITDAEVGGVDFDNRGIIAHDGADFYTSYSSLILFRQMEATSKKGAKYPAVLEKYFRNKKNAKGNPILVRLTFKPLL